MSIFKRHTGNMTTNIVLDKIGTSDATLDQYMRNIENDFARTKAEIAEMMAQEAQANRALLNLDKHINSYEEKAIRALNNQEEHEAVIFVSTKVTLETLRESYVLNAQVAKENVDKTRQMYDKLEEDFKILFSLIRQRV